MAQTVRDAALESRTARGRLPVQHKPYFRSLDPGLHLAYRKGERGGVWSARVYVGNGKYRNPPIGTADDKADADGVAVLSFSQAQAAARKLFEQAARNESGLPDLPTGPYTVADAMRDYIVWLEHEGRSETAIKNTTATAAAHILPTFGAIRLERLTTKQIRDWLAALAKAPPRLRVKPGKKQRHREVDMTSDDVRRQRRSTTNRIFSNFKAALNLAWRSDKVVNDKAWRAVRPFKGADASRARYLTIEECQRLMAACADDFRDLVRAALHTGARYSELARLTVADFNPDSGTVAVRISKNGKPRHVWLTTDGAKFFAAMVKRAGNRECLLVRADGEPWAKSWQMRPMRAACAAAKIKPAVGFHILRHTWASLTVMGGAPLLVVARNLGHTTTRMVEKHYGHLSPSFEADAIRAAAPRF